MVILVVGGKIVGNVGLLKLVLFSYYILQLSSFFNYDNLNGWVKKENLKNYVVYEMMCNGQLWYVLVFGVYVLKEEVKKVVFILLVDVQVKNLWVKLLCQVQVDLK